MSGKGSRPRPFSVSQDQFAENFDKIFGRKENNHESEKTDQEVSSGDTGSQDQTTEKTL